MIFVFGSNAKGLHAGGAARFAHLHKGAILGQGEGLQGDSYAVPTMEGFEGAFSGIQRFLEFAAINSEMQFQVTRLGCGIAGFTDAEIAPLFANAPANCLFDEAWREYLPTASFWGSF